MNLTNPFREQLAKLPALNDALDLITARISAVWNVEHHADGTHGDVTVDSLSIADTSDGVGTIQNTLKPSTNGTLDLGGRSSEPFSPFYAWRTLYLRNGIEWAGDDVSLVSDHISAWSDRLSGSNRTTTGNVATSQTWLIEDSLGNDIAVLGGSVIIGSVLLAGGITLRRLVATSATFTNGLYERSRTTPVGEWVNVAFSAGDYTASGGAAWTVAVGDHVTVKYTLVGKTITFAFWVAATTIATATAPTISIAIPGGFSAAANMANPIRINSAGTETIGHAFVLTSGTTVTLLNTPSGTGFIVQADTLDIRGQITFEIT